MWFLSVLAQSPEASIKKWHTHSCLPCRAHTEPFVTEKNEPKDLVEGDLPSVLGGTNPRIEGNLDTTGAETESNAHVSSVIQDGDGWLETQVAASPSQSSWNCKSCTGVQNLRQNFPFSRLIVCPDEQNPGLGHSPGRARTSPLR